MWPTNNEAQVAWILFGLMTAVALALAWLAWDAQNAEARLRERVRGINRRARWQLAALNAAHRVARHEPPAAQPTRPVRATSPDWMAVTPVDRRALRGPSFHGQSVVTDPATGAHTSYDGRDAT